MNASVPKTGAWLDSLRRLADSLSALLRSRFELFTVEWQEEKLRLLDLLVWLALALAIGVAGIFIAITALAFWLWTLAGCGGLMGLAAAALAAAAVLLWRLRRKIKAGPLPFSQTAAEFRKDGKCLRGK